MAEMEKTAVADLEKRIWDLEGIRVLMRCPPNSEVGQYTFTRKAAGGTSLSDWCNSRLLPLIGPYGYYYDVIDGYGTLVHGRTHLDKIRATYEHYKENNK